ncbi:hypothetical protein I4U23_014433 [Adineta vaga]|nr:hypothetical protein I4U23_014433 [Adineta vaga]
MCFLIFLDLLIFIMSMIYFVLCALICATTISATLAPRDVYSAVIQNAQDKPIQCSILWSKPSGEGLESALFTVEHKQHYLASEKKMNMGTWEAHAAIQEIHCGNLILKAPFDKVTSPVQNWEFIVQQDKIVSVGPSS